MSSQRRPPISEEQIAEEEALATRYVLGEMSEEDFADFEARYASDAGFRERYDAWSSALDLSPSAQEPNVPTNKFQSWLSPPEGESLLARLGVIPAVIGALAAALLVAFVSNRGLLAGQATAPMAQAALESEAGEVLAEVTFDPASQTLGLNYTGPAQTDEQALEVWAMVAGGPPLSLGVMSSESAYTELALSAAQSSAIVGSVLMITVEPTGGAGAAGPTGEVVALGALPAP